LAGKDPAHMESPAKAWPTVAVVVALADVIAP
jgi:hypothetical protein